MTHDSPLISIIVVGLTLAFVFGAIANRLKISLLVGYLLAGVAVGPFTPGFIADQHLAPQLAEIGVILLMFGVGLHFSPKDLLAVRRVVIPGAILQIAVSTLLGMGLAWLLGWSRGAGFVFGLSLSVASTVVLQRALQDRRLADTERGRIAMGWLIFQDLLMVLTLVLLPPFASLLNDDAGATQLDLHALAITVGITLGKAAAFVVLMLVVGQRVIPALLHYVAHTGSRELFRLAVLAVALCVAFLAAELFGVSFALGAFFAGMVLSESELSQRAADESLPLRDAFAALFFISVGMLFDPTVLIDEPLPLLGALLVVIVGNAGMAFLVSRLMGYSLAASLTIAVGLGQIGEFSFILADLGIGLGLLSPRARVLILGTSILSILINPLFFWAVDRLRPRLERYQGKTAPAPEPEPPAELPTTTLVDHTILVGCGRVGHIVCDSLRRDGGPLYVIEERADSVAELHEAGIEALAANATQVGVLKAANIARARVLLVAIPQAFEAGEIVEQSRKANPQLTIIARAHFDAEVDYLRRLGATIVIMGEREIARGMIEQIRSLSGTAPAPP
ncbi:MAG: sodium:proton antiporter [Rhodospirillales bacterium]|nr:sodium:proton antiporter [Rhodospirillales bacterium]